MLFLLLDLPENVVDRSGGEGVLFDTTYLGFVVLSSTSPRAYIQAEHIVVEDLAILHDDLVLSSHNLTYPLLNVLCVAPLSKGVYLNHQLFVRV